MGWMSMSPSPRPLRAAPPRQPAAPRDGNDLPTPGGTPASTDNPDLPPPRPNLDDIPVGGEDVMPPSLPRE